MIKRSITAEILEAAKEYSVITIIGPRQSGKTTLAKAVFPKHTYCSLEDPDIRTFAQNDPRAFLNQYNKNIIFDEIQRVPELLSFIQTLVDQKKSKGRFILTGSHQLQLRAEISQSLAGRTSVLTLLPLSISELINHNDSLSTEDYLFKGFFPQIHSEKMNPTRFYSNYYKTYIERDVRQLIKLKDVTLFEIFFKLLAGRVGQVLNLSSLSNDVGASSTTLKEWLSILEASFIIFKLPPFYENFGKRVIKSPKYYLTDVGLLCYLLGIESPKQIMRDPLIGNIFENLVVIELLKQRYNQGKQSNLYFYRDSHGNEVDVIFQNGRDLLPIEIKSASTFNPTFLKGIYHFKKVTKHAKQGFVVYNGEFTPETEDYKVLNINTLSGVT